MESPETQKHPETILPREIEDEMKTSYLDYSMSVIVGRALPDVRDGLKPVHRRILFAMNELGMIHNKPFKKSARVVGECFVKDTLVLAQKGLKPVQDVKKGDMVYTQKGLEKVSEIYIMPKRSLLKVSLENGLANTVTKSQKFKVLNADWKFIWKEAEDLEKGDFIVVKSSYPEIKDELKVGDIALNANIAYLLGQLMSDGWVEKDIRLCFYSTSQEIIKRIGNILLEEFSYSPAIEEPVYQYETTNGQILLNKAFQIRINRKVINDSLISNFNLAGIKAKNKKIPSQILQSPRKVIFSFISGLIDGDGSIHKERNVIHYGTVSKELADYLLVLLQHFGIYGSKYIQKGAKGDMINGKRIKGREDFINLEFRGEYAHLLGRELDLAHEAKSDSVRALLTSRLGKSNHETLPYGSIRIFKELSKQHFGGGWYKDAQGNKFRMGVKHPSGAKIRYCKELYNKPLRISQIIEWGIREKLRKIGSGLYKFLETITEDKIQFMEVDSIEERGEEVTYDIQVENEHEFIANGMVAHNCLGKYHPHGDAAVYDSIVRMVQGFSLRYPLIGGQGNFGSIDGDSAAAMRYTEIRLKKESEEMLQDIDKKTVRFVPNFDGSLEEPTVLPSKLPNLLVNGSSGIAVGMATNIPPHNIREICNGLIALIANPEMTVTELMEHVRGPDFPTAGLIMGTNGIKSAYHKGIGRIKVRARTSVEAKGGRHSIIVTEIPYQTNKSLLIEQIAELVKGKRIEGISEIRDESDRDGLKIVIGLKASANQDIILNQLFKHTRMETTFGVIMLALVDNEPRILSLKEVMQYFINHRQDVIRKRTVFDLKNAEEKAHILEGIITALENVDGIIKKIRESHSVVDAARMLVSAYDLSQIQAKAILDMKLQKLASLEQQKIRQDHSETARLIDHLRGILADELKILAMIKEDLDEIKEKYSDSRRTEILDVEEEEIEIEDMIKKEDMVVTITRLGYIKRLPIDTYREQRRGGKGVRGAATREEDFVEDLFIANTHSCIMFFTNKAKVHLLKVYRIPEASRQARGTAIANRLELEEGEKVTAFVPVKDFGEGYLIMATKKGTIKKTALSLFSRPRKGGIIAISLDQDDELINVKKTDGSKNIILATRNGMAVKFHERDVRDIGRSAKGVRGIRLKGDDSVIGMVIAEDSRTLFTLTEKGYGKRTRISDYSLVGRGCMGVKDISCSDRNGRVAAIRSVEDDDSLLLMSKKGIAIRVPASNMSVIGRNTQGVRVMNLSQGDFVTGVAKIVKEDTEVREPEPQSGQDKGKEGE